MGKYSDYSLEELESIRSARLKGNVEGIEGMRVKITSFSHAGEIKYPFGIYGDFLKEMDEAEYDPTEDEEEVIQKFTRRLMRRGYTKTAAEKALTARLEKWKG